MYNGTRTSCHTFPLRFDHAYEVYNLLDSFSALSSGESSDTNWYLDSSASAHMTNELGVIIHPEPRHNSNRVMIGNGQLLHIKAVGTSYLKIHMVLGDYPLYIMSLSFLEICYQLNTCARITSVLFALMPILLLWKTWWRGIKSFTLFLLHLCTWYQDPKITRLYLLLVQPLCLSIVGIIVLVTYITVL